MVTQRASEQCWKTQTAERNSKTWTTAKWQVEREIRKYTRPDRYAERLYPIQREEIDKTEQRPYSRSKTQQIRHKQKI